MNINNEGYIKFNIDHAYEGILMPDQLFLTLSEWRTKLFEYNLIGETPEGIGYGNISIKFRDGFFITGSATGAKDKLDREDYAFVHGYNFENNLVKSVGEVKASSESMSHAAIYESNQAINGVIHIHSSKLWNQYINRMPTTSRTISFGTPEMAYEVKELLKNPVHYRSGVIIMGGHQDGIFTFGEDLNEAGERILKLMI